MDGVLFDSMPYHVEAWLKVMERHGMPMTREEVYLNEGRTGAGTIDKLHKRYFHTPATKELIETIYQEKCQEFSVFPEPSPMPGALELLGKVKASGLTPVLVTGSGQRTLFERIDRDFKGFFTKDRMVTAFDVKVGKPNPEPYLMGLEKARVKASEAIVVENAPIGVKAGHAAGVFTVAVNTGPLKNEALLSEGADLVYESIQALSDGWEELIWEIIMFNPSDPQRKPFLGQ